ncbi:hypothetical protein Avbf_10066 [Armadillidium vulgare]|nr:hypothetical protein Avbf_10066 [Armadillidium vulgare]
MSVVLGFKMEVNYVDLNVKSEAVVKEENSFEDGSSYDVSKTSIKKEIISEKSHCNDEECKDEVVDIPLLGNSACSSYSVSNENGNEEYTNSDEFCSIFENAISDFYVSPYHQATESRICNLDTPSTVI